MKYLLSAIHLQGSAIHLQGSAIHLQGSAYNNFKSSITLYIVSPAVKELINHIFYTSYNFK